jgi:hypothetical protein
MNWFGHQLSFRKLTLNGVVMSTICPVVCAHNRHIQRATVNPPAQRVMLITLIFALLLSADAGSLWLIK